ncbi:hypothetical protein BCR39DRAFT_547490 [Naematelia encephala]|uniref:Uncharacterized protein n=1 Tax=Naematelia encephala TaxID=71784 RepID=A0A1Y2ANQ0_9TREE|nr:hypothetical protein BCR39DRAFT_547490 [Naematelia encephala]
MSDQTHYLVVTYPSWAHTRSLIGLSSALQQLNPNLHLTILIASSRASAAALEFAQYPAIVNPSRRRIVHYGEQRQVKDGMWNPRGGFRVQCLTELEPLLQHIVDLDPLIDSLSGEEIVVPKIPLTAIISDLTLGAYARQVQKSTAEKYPDNPSIRVLGFGPYSEGSLAFLLLNVQGYGNFIQRCLAVVAQSGDQLAKEKLADELISSNGDLVQIPGLWPFYVYESNPVPKESAALRVDTLAAIFKVIPAWIDGLIVGWPSIFTKELHEPMAKQFGAFYSIGFQLPEASTDEWSVEDSQGACKAYLDAAQDDKSVIYVSFGSAVYAPTHQQLVVLLDVLEALEARYIMAEGNAPEETKEIMRARIGKGRDKGLLAAWAPQRAILSHRATALFLTHGGSNSAMEGILFQVPMIMWPATFDQPYISNELDKLGVAIELIQMRGGPSIGKPLARNGAMVHGTDEALDQELTSLFSEVKGVKGRTEEGGRVAVLRKRLTVVGEEVRVDREQGEAASQVRQLAFMGVSKD